MNKPISTDKALKNAFASSGMEGLKITPQIKQDCTRILTGKVSINDCVYEMLGRDKNTRRP